MKVILGDGFMAEKKINGNGPRGIALQDVQNLLLSVVTNTYDLQDIDSTVDKILATVGSFIDANRLYVFEFTKPGFCSNTYEWCSPGTESQIDFCQDFDSNKFDIGRIASGTFIVDDVSSLPEPDRKLLDPQGIKALAILPMITDGELLGFVGYDECERKRAWTDEEVQLLKISTALITPLVLHKHTAKETKQIHEIFQTVLDNIDMPIYVSDIDSYEILFANHYMRKIFPALAHGKGKPCWSILQKGQTGPCLWCPTSRLFDENGRPGGPYKWEFQNTVTKRWYLLNDSVITWIDGRQVHLETATDITELKRNEERLQHFASVDHMTGTFNREWGYKTLDETLRKGIGAGVLSCLCFLDLDGLKNVNDLYGHDEGDHLITSFVHAIRTFSRGSDVLCRWGGDEFLLCLYDCSENQARKIMGKIDEEFDMLKHFADKLYDHRFSYGIVEVWPEREYSSLDKLISKADELMYMHKTTKQKTI